MAWFIFNGVDSRDMGVIVRRLPDFHRPKEDATYIKVPGRDGRLRQKSGSVDSYQTTLTVNCHGRTLAEIYDWLHGSGWLISSNEPARKIDIDLYAQGNDDRFRLASGACWDDVTFSVYAQPYRYFVDDVIETAAASPAVLNNPGTAHCRPRITIRGSGDVTVTVGLAQMDFAGLTDGVVVDCELMQCLSLDGTQLLNGLTTMDEYPTLAPGLNYLTFTGDVSEITVEMRCRDL